MKIHLRFAPALILGICLGLAACQSSTRSEGTVHPLGDFESGLDGFGGNAISVVTTDAKTGKACAHFENPGDKWVLSGKNLDPRLDLVELRLWVKSTTAKSLGIQLTDWTGQIFMQRPTFVADGTWQQIRLRDFANGAQCWKGAEDHIWHGQCKHLEFVLEGGHNDILIDDIEAVVP